MAVYLALLARESLVNIFNFFKGHVEEELVFLASTEGKVRFNESQKGMKSNRLQPVSNCLPL